MDKLRIDEEFSAYTVPSEQKDELILQLKESGLNLQGGRNSNYGITHVRYGNMGYLNDMSAINGTFVIQVRKSSAVVKTNPLERFILERMPEPQRG